MNLFDAIKQRRSHRGQYQDRPIEDGDLNLVIDAARWTPSPFNVQPWELIIIQEADGKEVLADMTEQAINQQFKDTKFLRENSRWMRSTEEEWKTCGDGVLLTDHINLPKMLQKIPDKFTHRMLKNILNNAKPLAIMGHLGLGKIPAQEIATQVRESPLLMLIAMNNHRHPPGEGSTRWMWLSIGMLIQNILLAATSLNIGVQFISAPLESENDRSKIQQHFNIPNNCEVMTLLRLGYLNTVEGSSVRLSPSKFVHYERIDEKKERL